MCDIVAPSRPLRPVLLSDSSPRDLKGNGLCGVALFNSVDAEIAAETLAKLALFRGTNPDIFQSLECRFDAAQRYKSRKLREKS